MAKNANAIKKTTGEMIFTVFNTVFMVFLCLITFYPLACAVRILQRTGVDSGASRYSALAQEFYALYL